MVIEHKEPLMRETLYRVLNEGGIAIVPGDTIYGFIGKYPQTESKIRSVKGREEGKPFLVLVDNETLDALTNQDIPDELRGFWPGPLTLIVTLKDGVGTIAVRIPNDELQLELIHRLKCPLYSTSVNRSGKYPLNNIKSIIAEFETEVDLVVDGGDITEDMPSTIIDITKHPYRLIREGAIKPDLPV